MRALIPVVVACLAARAFAAPPPELLEKGKPVVHEVAAGDAHRFKIVLRANQVATGVVDQRGIDLALTTFDPAGKQLRTFDSPNGNAGPEPFVIEGKAAGTYIVEVKPFVLPPDAPPEPGFSSKGSYEAKLDDIVEAKVYEERQMARTIDSPRVLEIWKNGRDRKPAENERIWRELKGKSPLVEPYPGDPKDSLVTWIFRSKKPYVGLVGGPGLREKPMQRIGDTELWFLSARVPANATMNYAFIPADGPPPFHVPYRKDGAPDPRWTIKQIDPNNPKVNGEMSSVTLPGAVASPYTAKKADVPAGKIAEVTLDSALLKEKRRVGVYTPPGYDPKQKYPLVIAFDGEAYGLVSPATLPLTTVLDNLIAAKKIPPVVAALVANQGQRGRDLALNEPFGAFVAKELVPRMRSEFRAGLTPGDTIVTGSSLGGLASTFVALKHSSVIGKVLSNSGSYWFGPGVFDTDLSLLTDNQWMVKQFVAAPRLPIRFYMDAGVFEENLLDSNRRLRDVLLAKGYAVTYAEFPGGHDYAMWSQTIADGLIALLH